MFSNHLNKRNGYQLSSTWQLVIDYEYSIPWNTHGIEYKNVISLPSFRSALNSCAASKMTTTQTHCLRWKSFYQTILLENDLFKSVVVIHLEIQRLPFHHIIATFWGAIIGTLKDEIKNIHP